MATPKCIVHDVAQRTPEWAALRCGRLCGSRAADMLATIKSGGEAAGRRNLRVQLVLERITRRPQERTFLSQAMQDGMDREADGLLLYEALTGTLLQRVGYVSHPTLMAGASPDGIVGDWEGGVEVKSPLPATHLEYLETGKVPDEYEKQIQHLLWLTGLPWVDWVSYQPDFPEAWQMKVVRIHRDESIIADYERKVIVFLAEVDQKVAALATMTNLRDTLVAAAGGL